MTNHLITFDADDTLWVNEPNYVDVKRKLSELLLHYVDPAALEAHYYDAQIKNLQTFGYGTKSFMLAMIETAIELTNGAITAREIQQIITIGRRLLAFPIEILDDIPEALDADHIVDEYLVDKSFTTVTSAKELLDLF